jgi:hypothetical protein
VELAHTEELYFLIWHKVHLKTTLWFHGKIEVPKVFIKEENKTPYFSLVLLNDSQRALRKETKQIEFQLFWHLIRALLILLLRQEISVSISNKILLKVCWSWLTRGRRKGMFTDE